MCGDIRAPAETHPLSRGHYILLCPSRQFGLSATNSLSIATGWCLIFHWLDGEGFDVTLQLSPVRNGKGRSDYFAAPFAESGENQLMAVREMLP
jgi:hypothetical protein